MSAPETACRHCGLPAGSADAYCCYGCELAARIAAEGKERRTEIHGRITFSLLLSMVVMMLSLFVFAEDVYGAGAKARLAWMHRDYRVVHILLGSPVIILLSENMEKNNILLIA